MNRTIPLAAALGVAFVTVGEVAHAQLTRVSVDSSGNQVGGNSTNAVISADGRFVAFASTAGSLDGVNPGCFPPISCPSI